MAPSSETNPDDTGKPEDETMIDDDVTVTAETPTSKFDFIEAEMTDLNIRYEIPFRKGQANDDDFKLYVKILHAITTAFDKSTVRIYDNENARIRSFKEPKWQDKDYFDDHFKIHVVPSQRKSVIVHRIMTKKTISEIKNEPSVIQLLKASSTYLRGHFWKDDEVNLKDIGFLLSYIPTKHSKEFVANDIFERCSAIPDLYWTHAPEFKLIHAQPKIVLPGRKMPLKTHAFSVQVLAKDASTMNKFLQRIYEEDHHYMPYNMKKNFPKTVASGILAQNKLIKNTWVIVLVGIPRHAMVELANTILESSGVTGISETNRTDKNGRWNILVKESKFKAVRKLFTKHLQEWIHELPNEIQAIIPDSFPPPRVYQKNSYDDEDDDDDSSSGQVSYMSSCAQSYASFDDNYVDESYSQPPGRYTSYAAALSSTTPTPTGTEVLVRSKRQSPVAGKTNSEPSTTTAYENTITNLQHEVTIAQLQAEIINLKAVIIGATTPSTVTEISTPLSNIKDTSTADDRMTSIEINMELMTKQFTSWMAETRKNDYSTGYAAAQAILTTDTGTKHPIDEEPLSQRSKRIDTRTTPTRSDPMNIDDPRTQLFPGNEEEPYTQSKESRENEILYRNREGTGTSPPLSVYKHIHPPDHPYDPNRTQYTFQENGDGTLFCSGVATPSDFIDGVIQGPRPTNAVHQQELLLSPKSPRDIPYTPPAGLHTQPEQTEIADPLNSIQTLQGQPSPERETPSSVTGSQSPSLPAEGAETVHA
jgi:hypothetical protein